MDSRFSVTDLRAVVSPWLCGPYIEFADGKRVYPWGGKPPEEAYDA